MDTLFDGFAGAILTAIVTLAGPYMARNYAVKAVKNTAPKKPLPRLAGFIVRMFGAIEIHDAKRFKVPCNDSYTEAHFDFSVSWGWGTKGESKEEVLYLSLVLPGKKAPERIEDPDVGWTRVFDHAATQYRLTLVKKDAYDDSTFELRVLREAAAEEVGGEETTA